eukprot:GEMP01042080.1.p1 GENE.GEMP01042080.1~~GEMP01042080.1.p1  ORF type:complete len:399 (+),score=36.50 GEMP01042080.1:87-1283(+)
MALSIVAVWLLVVFLWGTMYVPVRKFKVYDGVFFQWYMSCGILFAAIFIHFILGPTTPPGSSSYATSFPIYAEGIAGGAAWAISNILVVPTVKLLGLGVGFTLYHSVNLLMGYLNGKYGLYGLPVEETSWEMDFSVVWFLASFVLICFVKPTLEDGHERTGSIVNTPMAPDADFPESSEVIGNEEQPADPAVHALPCDELKLRPTSGPLYGIALPSNEAEVALLEDANGTITSTIWIKRIGGIAIGLLAGLFCSTNMVPYMLWVAKTAKYNPSVYHFTFSQSLGIFFASTVYTIIASLAKRIFPRTNRWPRQPMVLPAMASGIMWTTGFLCATIGVQELGMSVGYVISAVGPVAVSALCTHFIFREIQGKDNHVKFWTAIFLQAVGVVLDAGFKPRSH